MPSITRIDFENFKGMAGSLALGQRTLLHGPNGAGKTAALWAAQWAITGKSPFGATNEASAQLFAGGAGSVTLHLDDGGSIKRMLFVADGAYKQVIAIDGRQCEKRHGDLLVLKRCGDFAPQFNLRAFTDLSPEKRRAFVLDLIGGKECDALTQRLAEADETINRLARELREAEAAIRSIAKPATTRPPHAVRQESEALETEIRDMRQQIGNVEGQAAAWARTAQRITWLRNELAKGLAAIPAEMAPLTLVEVEEAKAVAAEVRAAFIFLPDVTGLVDAEAAARAELARLDQELGGTLRKEHEREWTVVQAKGRVDDLKARIAEAEKSPWAEAWKLYENGIEQTTCDERAEQAFMPLGDFITAQLIKAAPTGLPEAEAALAAAEKARNEAAQQQAEILVTLARATIESDKLASELKVCRGAQIEAQQQIHELLFQADQARGKANAIRQQAENAASMRTTWEVELAELERSAATVPPASDDDIKAILDGKMVELAGRKAELIASQQAEAIQQAVAMALGRIEALRADLAARREAREAIRAERDQKLSEALSRLLGPLNAFLAKVRRGRDARVDLLDGHGRPTFRVAWTEDDGREAVLSPDYPGSGWAVFGAGLIYAMLQNTETPFRILMLDAGEIDSPSLTALMDGLTDLPGLDQIIVTSHLGTAAVTAPEGWESRLMPMAVKREEVLAR